MRRGIGLITALIILLLMASLVAVVVKISFVTVKHTSDAYIKERGELFMQSVVENTLMAIEGYDRKNKRDCLKKLTFTDEDNRFTANVEILRYYVYKGDDMLNYCSVAVPVETQKSTGNVLIKVVVQTNLSNPKNNNKYLRLIKTTLQRP
ncbi:MAG: hypothetical protein GXO62_04805 [Epsilonproteobacteria bacterium]|nr:hypothetical protein [Campylobacterota bacterium]